MISARAPTRRYLMSRTLLAALLASAAPLCAAVKLASPFTSHMVLQRDLPVPVWGRADAGEEVKVEFAGQTKTVTADADGKWRVDLDPLAASADARTLTVGGSKTATPIVLDDVLVGEVWLASGQSNMAFTVSKSRNSWAGVENEEKVIAAADYPHIRMFTAEPIRAAAPQTEVPGEWLVCSPQTVPGFSAVGYYFARALNRELKVPVGVVTLSYGASTAQAWIRREAIAADPKLKPELDHFDDVMKQYVPPSDEELAAWHAAVGQGQGRQHPTAGRAEAEPVAESAQSDGALQRRGRAGGAVRRPRRDLVPGRIHHGPARAVPDVEPGR